MLVMPMKNLKHKFSEFLIALGNSLKSSNGKKQLDPQSFQKEIKEFVDTSGVNIHDPDIDLDKFQDDFKQYLESKNYECENITLEAQHMNLAANPEKSEKLKLPGSIDKISEDLNIYTNGMDVFVDTTSMTPGLVCYTIKKIAPTSKKPYVTYKPEPRVITQVHDNGVNGGTIFLTCAHKVVKSADFNGRKDTIVVSEDEALYTPLTKEQAIYVCKILNAQSRIFYTQQMKRQQRTK